MLSLGECAYELLTQLGKRHLPQTPTAKTFADLGQDVNHYDCAEILLLLIVRYHRDAPPNGTLLPNRRLVSTWSLESYNVCSVDYCLFS